MQALIDPRGFQRAIDRSRWAFIRIFNVFLMRFLYYSGLMLVAGRDT